MNVFREPLDGQRSIIYHSAYCAQKLQKQIYETHSKYIQIQTMINGI